MSQLSVEAITAGIVEAALDGLGFVSLSSDDIVLLSHLPLIFLIPSFSCSRILSLQELQLTRLQMLNSLSKPPS